MRCSCAIPSEFSNPSLIEDRKNTVIIFTCAIFDYIFIPLVRYHLRLTQWHAGGAFVSEHVPICNKHSDVTVTATVTHEAGNEAK